MSDNKYKFSEQEDFEEVYKIAKFQFKKIINNFNEFAFRHNFIELFYGESGCHKLFLRKNDVILCGTLAYLFDDCAFCDIFFWNERYEPTNTIEFRFFCEKFFIDTSKIGINNMIVPMDKSRHKHESFKKYCQKLYFTEKELHVTNSDVKYEYNNHYLLQVNYDNYFKKSKEVKRIKP